MKYEGLFAVTKPLAQIMATAWPEWAEPVDLILPVPLHPARERERGYDQATLLARALCDELPFLPPLPEARLSDALSRTRWTRPQVGLGQDARERNVSGAFSSSAEFVAGRHILLVDDVCTSGATMIAAAKALLAAGARRVSGYSVARAHLAGGAPGDGRSYN